MDISQDTTTTPLETPTCVTESKDRDKSSSKQLDNINDNMSNEENASFSPILSQNVTEN